MSFSIVNFLTVLLELCFLLGISAWKEVVVSWMFSLLNHVLK